MFLVVIFLVSMPMSVMRLSARNASGRTRISVKVEKYFFQRI
jgi:hypothetical protein